MSLLKKWKCYVTLPTGWQITCFVDAIDSYTAMKLAETQTGGKCSGAVPYN